MFGEVDRSCSGISVEKLMEAVWEFCCLWDVSSCNYRRNGGMFGRKLVVR